MGPTSQKCNVSNHWIVPIYTCIWMKVWMGIWGEWFTLVIHPQEAAPSNVHSCLPYEQDMTMIAHNYHDSVNAKLNANSPSSAGWRVLPVVCRRRPSSFWIYLRMIWRALGRIQEHKNTVELFIGGHNVVEHTMQNYVLLTKIRAR